MIRSSHVAGVMFFGIFGALAAFVFGFAAPQIDSAANPPSNQTVEKNVAAMGKTGVDADSEPVPFAFIELFTSEGCSSCPSADKNLERIAAEAKSSGQNIYTLSYHVDYWDYLGWKDPYSGEQFSDRQRSYARQFQSRRVYTPQMVVNGQVEFVGSNQKTSQKAIVHALQYKTDTAISVTSFMNDGVVVAHWKSPGAGKNDKVHVALVQNSGQQKVNRGENARRNLTHINIVRQLKTVSAATKEGKLELVLPDGVTADEFHVVAFTQSSDAVTAVSQSAIAANPPASGQEETDVVSNVELSSDSMSRLMK